MKTFLEGIFDKICPSENWKLNENVFIRAFEGKSHLQKEIPKKAKVYKHFHEPVKMVVIQDQDSSDCKVLKKKIQGLISPTQFQDFKIRIVCKELENWYLGDLDALEKVIPNSTINDLKGKAKFRQPEILNGKEELKKLIPEYGAIGFAREIAPHINIQKNTASSFQNTIIALQQMLKDEGNQQTDHQLSLY